MKHPWTRWVGLLDLREDATALAICRLVVGTVLFFHLLEMWVSGAAAAVWVDAKFGGIRPVDLQWLQPLGGATAANVRGLLVVALLGSALLAAGVLTQVTSVVTWLSFRTLSGLNDHSGGSSDDVLINVLFVLMFSGCGGALSFDQRGRPAPEVPAWPRFVLIGQLVLIYWTTGLQKVSAGWLPGGPLDALWYILQQPTWQRAPMLWLAPAWPLTRVATLVTWLFEQAAPLLLLAFWFRYTRARPGRVRALFNRLDFRSLYLGLGVAMHLGIFFAMEVGPFFGAMLSLYACCFTAAEWKALFARSQGIGTSRSVSSS